MLGPKQISVAATSSAPDDLDNTRRTILVFAPSDDSSFVDGGNFIYGATVQQFPVDHDKGHRVS